MKFFILFFALLCGFAEARTSSEVNPLAKVIFDQRLDTEEGQLDFVKKMNSYLEQKRDLLRKTEKAYLDELEKNPLSNSLDGLAAYWRAKVQDLQALEQIFLKGLSNPETIIMKAEELELRGTLPEEDMNFLQRIAKICHDVPLGEYS